MPATFFLLRHGEAEKFSHDKKDAQRNLTENGQMDIQQQGKFLQQLHPDAVRIYHSPFIRAIQTARILQNHLEGVLIENPELEPAGNVVRAVMPLVGLEGSFVLVSHLPLIADLTHYLTGQNVRFYPGTLARIDKPDEFKQRGMLTWVRHPISE